MNVYVVTEADWDDFSVVAVYRQKADAEAAVANYDAAMKAKKRGSNWPVRSVAELAVIDVPETVAR